MKIEQPCWVCENPITFFTEDEHYFNELARECDECGVMNLLDVFPPISRERLIVLLTECKNKEMEIGHIRADALLAIYLNDKEIAKLVYAATRYYA